MKSFIWVSTLLLHGQNKRESLKIEESEFSYHSLLQNMLLSVWILSQVIRVFYSFRITNPVVFLVFGLTYSTDASTDDLVFHLNVEFPTPPLN